MTHADCLVVGAGLAGAAAAQALRDAGYTVTVVSEDEPGGLSPPAAILHPLPGRSCARAPVEWLAFEVAMRWLRQAPIKVAETSMVRPLTGTGGDRLRASYVRENDAFPPWFHAEILTRAGRDVLEYRPAFSLDMGQLCRAWLEGVPQVRGVVSEVFSSTKLKLSSGDILEADCIVVANGVGLSDLIDIELRSYAGELLLLDTLDREAMVSAGGHIAPRPGGGVSVGATIYEVGQDVDLEEKAERLLERLGKHVDGLASLKSWTRWHGIRATPQDRFPVVGRSAQGCWVLGGLGSRGLYWAPFLAETLVEAMNGEPIPEAIHLGRLT